MRLRDLTAHSMPFDAPARKQPKRVTLLLPNGRRLTLNETNETAAFIEELCKRGCKRVPAQVGGKS